MGGRAFLEQGVETRRVDRQEYFRIWEELKPVLSDAFGTWVDIPFSLRNKETFGDIDIIVTTSQKIENWEEYLQTTFGPTTTFHNGNVHSFVYDNFQVDLVVAPREQWFASRSYYSWNDLGNLIGRIAHKMGLKYGHDGLSMVYREDTHQIFEHNLLGGKDPADYLSFFTLLGLDINVYANGFDKPEDLYEFIAQSKYFNPSMFAYEDLNHTNRTRNRKRPIYAGFLQWIEEQKAAGRKFNEYVWKENKDVYLHRIKDHFPQGYAQFCQKKMEWFQKREEKVLFNGEVVSEVLGITGKELGMFMSYLAKVHGGKDAAAQYILQGPIEAQIETQYNNFMF